MLPANTPITFFTQLKRNRDNYEIGQRKETLVQAAPGEEWMESEQVLADKGPHNSLVDVRDSLLISHLLKI